MVCVLSCSVMPTSLQPHGLKPARYLCPWDFSSKNTGVGCHFLLFKWRERQMQSPQAQPDPACLNEKRPEPVEVDKACYSHKTGFQVLVQSWHFCKYLSRGEAGPALGFEIRLIRHSGHKLVKEKSGFSWATISDSCRSGNSNPPMTDPISSFLMFPSQNLKQ